MLVLKRKEGQWVEIVHRSGDVIRVRVYDIQINPHGPNRANLAFDDDARHFEIRRPERRPAAPSADPAIDVAPIAVEPATAITPPPAIEAPVDPVVAESA